MKNYVLHLPSGDLYALMIVCDVDIVSARDVYETIEEVITPFPWNPRVLTGTTAHDYQHHFVGVKTSNRNFIDGIMDVLMANESVKMLVESGRVVLCNAPEFDNLWNQHKF